MLFIYNSSSSRATLPKNNDQSSLTPRNGGMIATENVMLNIRISDKTTVKFVIHKGEKVDQIIRQFANDYKLDKHAERLLKKSLEAELNASNK